MKIFVTFENSLPHSEFLLIQDFLNWMGFFLEFDSEHMDECDFLLFYGNELPSHRYMERFSCILQVLPDKFMKKNDIRSILHMLDIPSLNEKIPVFCQPGNWKNKYGIASHLAAIEGEPVFYRLNGKHVVISRLDFFTNILYHLKREEEKSHDNFHPAQSILYEVLSIPVADVLIHVLQQLILLVSDLFQCPVVYKKRWPGDKKLLFILSHDVDLTRKWGPKSFITRGLPLLLKGDFKGFNEALVETLSLKNSYWKFPELFQFYKENEFKSTFFFLANPWEDLSYRYNIRRKIFKDLFKTIHESGHELALHNSKYSFGNKPMILKEKKILEENSGLTINGIRQHFLNLSFPDAYEFFGDLPFNYDSSLAYNERYGFRGGTSLPFLAYQKNKNILYEIPFALFEYHLSSDYSIQHIKSMLKTLTEIEGVFHFLFHPGNLGEPFYRKIFYYILDYFIGREIKTSFTLTELIQYFTMWKSFSMKVFKDNRETKAIIKANKDAILFIRNAEIITSRKLLIKKVNQKEYIIKMNEEEGVITYS